MLRIVRYLSKAEIGQMLIALVTIVGQVYFDLKLPDYMSDITTLVETPGSHMKDIWIAGGKMLLISLGSAACAIITGYIAARVAASFTQRLRSLEFRKVESFGPAEMSKFSTASLITRSTNDVTQVQMFITMGLQLIVKSPIMAVWAVCKIAGEGFEWTLATGIAVVILLAAIVIMMAMVMPKFKAMQALTDNINLVARENLTGLRVVRAYNAEDYQEAKFTKANKDLTDTQLFTNRVMAFMMPLMNTIMNGLMLAVYWIGTYLIDAAGLKDKLTVFSNMVVFSNYSVQVIMSFLLMSMVFVLWPRADVSAQRIMEVLDTEPIVENGTKTAADVAKTGQRGTVEFRNVSFTYPDSREAMLEGINFTAEQGQTVAFIGSTGSGKTTMVLESLIPALKAQAAGELLPEHVRELETEGIRRANLIDATPIGANVRSTVATYADIHDELRRAFARCEAAKTGGWKAGDFSYNTGRLRCPTCDGTGSISLDVQFLPDVTIECPDCCGSRYAPEADAIRRAVKGESHLSLSLPQLMAMSVDQALAVTHDLKKVHARLTTLHDLGLGYLTLGEPTPALSGGEAQRLKLASEMGKAQSDAVFVFDEPTIGLHPLDVRVLLGVFDRLVASGATVVVIEHDLDVIANADWIIDMGPGGGESGGRIVATGTPEQVAANPSSITGRYLG